MVSGLYFEKTKGIGNEDEDTSKTQSFVTLAKNKLHVRQSTAGILSCADVSSLEDADVFGKSFMISYSDLAPSSFDYAGTDKSVSFNFIVTQPVLTKDGWSNTDTVNYPITATFDGINVINYSVTATSSGHGTVSVNYYAPGIGIPVTLTAVPDTGYHLKEYQVLSGGIRVRSDGTFTMPDQAEVCIFSRRTKAGVHFFCRYCGKWLDCHKFY